MGRPSITFNRGTSGLGRPLPGMDHYSGMVFYIADGNLPSGFSTINRVQKIFSLAQLESLGVLNTHQNEVKGTGTVTITAVGSTGNTINISIQEPAALVSLGTYTQAVGDTTATPLATNLTALINSNTATTGYTATNTGGVITITARTGLGTFLNTGTPIVKTVVGTITSTTSTTFSGGVASDLDQVHYHVSEAFRLNPQLVLWVMLYTPQGSSYTFSELGLINTAASGNIRQLGVYINSTTLSFALVSALHNQLITLAGASAPASAVLTADISSDSLTSMLDMSTQASYRVTSDIAQDGGTSTTGYQLFKALGKTVGTMGATIGTISLAKVNECIGWVQKFNVTDGTNLETPAFGNGVLFTDPSITSNLLDTLYDQQYSYLVLFNNVSGTFFVDSNTCTPKSNTFCQIENVRTVDKAIRGIKTNVTPALNGPLLLNPNGTPTELTLAEFERLIQIQLDQMAGLNGEISAYEIEIDPTQVVSSSSQLDATVDIEPVGVGRNLVFNINEVSSLPTT